jgi:hypothetical protein
VAGAAHNRRGSVVPVNVDRAALNYQVTYSNLNFNLKFN